MHADFVSLARRHLAFLEARYGFHPVAAAANLARWESDRLFVEVGFDSKRSYEIGLEFGQLEPVMRHGAQSFSLGDLLGVHGVELANRPWFQASDSKRLNDALSKIGELLLVHGDRALKGEQREYEKLHELGDAECEGYAIAKRLASARHDADAAWHTKDFKSVVRLFGGILPHLTPSEQMRYKIAAKYADQS